ncbi:XRE family transcriptional regulator [Listeria monocytogenes]|uniref:helix-turn-helix domain-containing protein n=1 Tax=Listeria monocytogenes TaxID=1639 RepID=UPI0010CFDA3E|nr:helix-turn-helix transcriptional regulator [Listeria monocytogenes]EAC7181328.1 XRE family transcriptional regulator [Listeria monocytogenes]EAF1189807.1 XRE family transcriptional regulator [Listeria monocytogenes]EAK8400087.1 XRE family transcriptional regulator [Listeria monocytogenes]EIL9238506.1 helix-turn-helix transcriptional regulator [Listeria monocytogenes]MBC6362292.1 XRE family transcriptional regulator [Listeria monocytogenes]
MNDHDLIFERLYTLLREKNLTMNRLATLSGLSQSTLSSLEIRPTGVPKADTLRLICKALEISVHEFFDFPPYNEVEK